MLGLVSSNSVSGVCLLGILCRLIMLLFLNDVLVINKSLFILFVSFRS